MLLDYLDLVGLISSKTFSTHFSGSSGESFIDFGQSRESAVSDSRDMVDIKVNKGFFYSAIPQGVRFGEELSGQEFALDGSEAIFTTGLSLSLVPRSISPEFFKRLLDGVNAYEDNGVFYNDC